MAADVRESDEVDSATTRQPRSSGLTLLGLLGGAVLAAMLIGQLTAPDPSPRPATAVAAPTASDRATTIEPDVPIGVESLKRCTVHMGGLTLGDHLQIPGYPLERWDCDAPPKGPWSVVIRAAGGHFGVHGAVVTFPIDPVRGGLPSTKPEGGAWNPGAQMLVWPLGSSHAQIVGDLGQSTLEDLADRVTDVAGRPRFAGLDGFAVVATTTYGSPVVHEMRYDAMELGQKSTLGDGLVFTGVTWAASFETLAFEIHAESSGFVRGKPAVYSSALGGSGTLAWESAAGEVTYIGYSGGLSSPEAIDALRALADKGRVLTPAQWETKDRFPVAGTPDRP
jgi:hypothetical protein